MKGVKKERPEPKPGCKFIRNWKGTTYKMLVVNDGDRVKYEVNGEIFKSPTGAAKYVTKHEVNGWAFWKIDKSQIV